MVTEFTPLQPTEFVSDNETTTFEPISPTKFISLAETAKAKEDNYFTKVLEKQQAREQALANKQVPTIPTLSPNDQKELETWRYNKEYNETLAESTERNRDAWFNPNSVAGQVGNLATAVGANTVSKVILKAYTALPSLANAVSRASLDEGAYVRTKKILEQQKQGITPSAEDQDWMANQTDGIFGDVTSFEMAKGIISREDHIQAVNELGLKIESVINSTATDLAAVELKRSNAQAMKEFKEGDGLNSLAAIGTFFGGMARVAIHSPEAVAQFAAESIPYSIAMVLIGLPAIGATAVDIHESASRAFFEEYGDVGTTTEQAISAGAATLSAALDYVGGRATVLGKSIGGGAVKSLLQLAKVTGSRVPRVLTRGLLAATGRGALRVAEGVVEETITEGFQRTLEDAAGLKPKDYGKIKAEDSLLEAAIGGLSGGAISATSATPNVLKYKGKDADADIKDAVVKEIDEFKKTDASKDLVGKTPKNRKEANKKLTAALAELQRVVGLKPIEQPEASKKTSEELKAEWGRPSEESDTAPTFDAAKMRAELGLEKQTEAEQKADASSEEVTDPETINEIHLPKDSSPKAIAASKKIVDKANKKLAKEQKKADKRAAKAETKREKLEVKKVKASLDMQNKIIELKKAEIAYAERVQASAEVASRATEEEITAAVEEMTAALIARPTAGTPVFAQEMLKYLNRIDIETISPEAKTLIETLAKIEAVKPGPGLLARLIKKLDKKAGTNILEPSLDRIKRGEDTNDPYLIVEGIQEVLNNTKTTEEEKPALLKKRNKAFEALNARFEKMPESTRKERNEKTLEATRIDKLVSSYTQASVNTEKTNTVVLEASIDLSIESGEIIPEIEQELVDVLGSSETFSEKKAQELLDSKVKLSDNTKKAVKEYIAFKKTVNTTLKDIRVGDGTSAATGKGIIDYMNNVNRAIKDDNKSEANSELQKLAVWVAYHSLKAANGLIRAKEPIYANKLEHEGLALVGKRLAARYVDKFGEKPNLDMGALRPKVLKMINKERTRLSEDPKLRFEFTKEPTLGRFAEKNAKPIQTNTDEEVKLTPVEPTVSKKETVESVVAKEAITPLEELATKEEVKLPAFTEFEDAVGEVVDNIDAYIAPVEQALSEKLLTSPDVKTAAEKLLETIKLFKQEQGTREPITAMRIITAVRYIRGVIANKIKTQLRNKLFLDPISIRPSSKAWKMPTHLSDIFVAKTGIVNNIFQKSNVVFDDLEANIEAHTGVKLVDRTTDQKNVIKHLNELYSKFSKLLNDVDNNILLNINAERVKDSKFSRVPYENSAVRDAMTYFTQEDPITKQRYIDPNLTGAFTAVALEWLGTIGPNSLNNTPEDIVKLLNLPEGTLLSSSQLAAMTDIGMSRASLERNLGNQIFNLLELKLKKDTEFEWAAPHLKAALGQLTVTLLLDTGYLTERSINIDDLIENPSLGTQLEDSDKRGAKFVKIAQSKESKFKPRDDIDTISRDVSSAEGVIREIFGIEGFQKFPEFAKPKDEQRVYKGTRNKVAQKTNDFLNKQSKKIHKLNRGLYDIWEGFDEEYQYEMAGLEDGTQKHFLKEKSIDAVNDLIKRDIKNFKQFTALMNGNLDKSFFFPQEVWKSGRIGMVSNMVNPLFSKIQRYLITRPEWDNKLDMANKEDRNGFIKAVAQSFGISTDKTSMDKIAAKLDAKLSDASIIDAVNAIQSIEGKPTESQQQLITLGVHVGGKKMHSLHGLIELAKAVQTVGEDGKVLDKLSISNTDSFTTNLTIEVDGKTNGIALALLHSGADGEGNFTQNIRDLLNAVGIMTGTETNSIDWAEQPGNKDLYETVTDSMMDNVDAITNSPFNDIELVEKKKTIKVLEPFVGKLREEDGTITGDGRGFSKYVVIAFLFGQGKKAQRRTVSNTIIENIYDKVAEYHNESEIEHTSQQLRELEDVIRFLSGNEDFEINEDEALTFEFKDKQLIRAERLIDETYGDAIVEALSKTFSGIIKYREALDQSAELMFEAFSLVYNRQLETLKKEIAKNGVPREPSLEEKYALLDSDEIKAVLPSFKGPFSKGSSIKDGVSKDLADSIIALSEDKSKTYGPWEQVQQEYSRPVKNSAKLDGSPSQSSTSNLEGLDFKSLGIKAMIRFIHHNDSAIQQEMMELFDIWNIHDATIGSIQSATDRGIQANKIAWEMSQGYSGLDNMQDRLDEIIGNLSRKDKAQLNTNIIANKSTFRDITYQGEVVQVVDLNYALNRISDTLTNAVAAREQIFKTVHHIDQYVDHGSSYWNEDFSTEKEALAAVDEAIDDILGSGPDSDTDADPSTAYTKIIDEEVTSRNIERIFDDLDGYGGKTENDSHKANLKAILLNVISGAIRPANALRAKIREGGIDTGGSYYKGQINVDIGSGMPGANNIPSGQEVFVHELLHAITKTAYESSFAIRRQIEKLFELAKAEIDPDIFLPQRRLASGKMVPFITGNQQDAKDAAQAQWNYIFDNKRGYSHHEFIAHGLANEVFRDALNKVIVTSGPRATTMLGRVEKVFAAIMDFFTTRFYKHKGKAADEVLIQLIGALTAIKDKNASILQSNKSFDVNAKLLRALDTFIMKPYNKMYNTNRGKSKGVIGNAIALPGNIRTIANSDEASLIARRLKRNMKITEDHFLVKLIREIIIRTPDKDLPWHKMMRKSKAAIDSMRKTVADTTKKYILDSYITKLSKDGEKVMHKVLVKPDLASIFTQYGENVKDNKPKFEYDYKDIVNMLRNKDAIETEITDLIADIFKGTKSGRLAFYYQQQANALGFYLATGKTAAAELNLNAYNIARQFGVEFKVKDKSFNLAFAEKRIDALATLYALRYTSEDNKNEAADIIEREFTHKKGANSNGITASLDTTKRIKKDSAKELFNSKHLMTKGYHARITNPNVGIKVDFGDDATIDRLKREGYVKQPQELGKDIEDPNRKPLFLYVTRENSLNERVRTIVSLTSMQSLGTDLVDIYANVHDGQPYEMAEAALAPIFTANQDRVKRQYTKLSGDLSKSTSTYFTPIRNENGDTSGYRYIMNDHNRRTILEEEERIGTVLGATDASIVDKGKTNEFNNKVVDQLLIDFNQQHKIEPEAFKEISLHSPDGEKYQELYKLMPEPMREYMRQEWGDDKMFIREELGDLVFGYRKASVINTYVGKAVNNAMVHANRFIEKIAPKIAYTGSLPLKAIEDRVQELIKIAKDNIVVKSGSVLINNTVSNTLLLKAKGMSWSDAVKLQFEAYQAIEDYQDKLLKRDLIQRRLDSETMSTTKRANLSARVANLDKLMKLNPASFLVDEGIFQSIVEDIDVDADVYNTTSKIARKAEEWSNEHLPKVAVTVGKLGWMAKSTTMYQTLFKLTQYGDFVSRYALYQHMKNESVKGRTDEKNKRYFGKTQDEIDDTILQEVVDTFINYDVPTSPEMQYLNDIGAMMFTKFTFRIQKIIVETFKERPATTLGIMALQAILSATTGIHLSYITDSWLFGEMMNKIGNPIRVILGLATIPALNTSLGL